MRVLEDALQILAREHHDLEKSIISSSYNVQQSNNVTLAESLHIPSSMAAQNRLSIVSRGRSFACLSDTDIDEFFDAFDDMEDEDNDFVENISDRIIDSNEMKECVEGDNSIVFGKLELPNDQMFLDGVSCDKSSKSFFQTAQETGEATINDSISTLSPDDEEKTLASLDFQFIR